MFTGLIEEIGEISSVRKGIKSSVLSIRGETIFSDLKLGDSVAVNGVCLTVNRLFNNIFSADVMSETLARSSLGDVTGGSHVNLERAMPMNGRFGGHMVSGHIDGIGVISAIQKEDIAIWYTIKTSDSIMRYIVEKGSVAMDGISLTVARTGTDNFSVSITPHTLKSVILKEKSVGSTVNLENDLVGKYIERFLNPGKAEEGKTSNISREFLVNAGFY